MRQSEKMLAEFEESERIAARIEAIHRLRPDLAREAERLLRECERAGISPLELIANRDWGAKGCELDERIEQFGRAIGELVKLALEKIRPRRNRRRRSSILCKIGIHDWEAWELSTQGLRFVKRCRRRGCRAARALKTAALGPTEPISPARLERGGSDG